MKFREVLSRSNFVVISQELIGLFPKCFSESAPNRSSTRRSVS